jgi:hypothetical protein
MDSNTNRDRLQGPVNLIEDRQNRIIRAITIHKQPASEVIDQFGISGTELIELLRGALRRNARVRESYMVSLEGLSNERNAIAEAITAIEQPVPEKTLPRSKKSTVDATCHICGDLTSHRVYSKTGKERAECSRHSVTSGMNEKQFDVLEKFLRGE